MTAVVTAATATVPDAAAVRAALPHRYPMLLVDAVRELVPGERIVAQKAITVNEPWYAGLAEGAADFGYPPVLLLESWAQTAGVLIGADPDAAALLADSVMLFGSATGVTYPAAAVPGDVVTHRVRIGRRLADTVVVDGDSRVGDVVVMTVAKALVTFRPAAVLRPADPE